MFLMLNNATVRMSAVQPDAGRPAAGRRPSRSRLRPSRSRTQAALPQPWTRRYLLHVQQHFHYLETFCSS